MLPTTHPDGGAGNTKMIHVTTTAPSNGLVQVFAPSPPVQAATFIVRVFIVQGHVAVGIGNGGSTTPTALSGVIGKWLTLTGKASNSPVTEMVIYSDVVQFSDFHVDLASVTPVPGEEL